jgi:hypothetical protein
MECNDMNTHTHFYRWDRSICFWWWRASSSTHLTS